MGVYVPKEQEYYRGIVRTSKSTGDCNPGADCSKYHVSFCFDQRTGQLEGEFRPGPSTSAQIRRAQPHHRSLEAAQEARHSRPERGSFQMSSRGSSASSKRSLGSLTRQMFLSPGGCGPETAGCARHFSSSESYAASGSAGMSATRSMQSTPQHRQTGSLQHWQSLEPGLSQGGDIARGMTGSSKLTGCSGNYGSRISRSLCDETAFDVTNAREHKEAPEPTSDTVAARNQRLSSKWHPIQEHEHEQEQEQDHQDREGSSRGSSRGSRTSSSRSTGAAGPQSADYTRTSSMQRNGSAQAGCSFGRQDEEDDEEEAEEEGGNDSEYAGGPDSGSSEDTSGTGDLGCRRALPLPLPAAPMVLTQMPAGASPYRGQSGSVQLHQHQAALGVSASAVRHAVSVSVAGATRSRGSPAGASLERRMWARRAVQRYKESPVPHAQQGRAPGGQTVRRERRVESWDTRSRSGSGSGSHIYTRTEGISPEGLASILEYAKRVEREERASVGAGGFAPERRGRLSSLLGGIGGDVESVAWSQIEEGVDSGSM